MLVGVAGELGKNYDSSLARLVGTRTVTLTVVRSVRLVSVCTANNCVVCIVAAGGSALHGLAAGLHCVTQSSRLVSPHPRTRPTAPICCNGPFTSFGTSHQIALNYGLRKIFLFQQKSRKLINTTLTSFCAFCPQCIGSGWALALEDISDGITARHKWNKRWCYHNNIVRCLWSTLTKSFNLVFGWKPDRYLDIPIPYLRSILSLKRKI